MERAAMTPQWESRRTSPIWLGGISGDFELVRDLKQDMGDCEGTEAWEASLVKEEEMTNSK